MLTWGNISIHLVSVCGYAMTPSHRSLCKTRCEVSCRSPQFMRAAQRSRHLILQPF